MVATLLLPWLPGENDLRGEVLEWLDSRDLDLLGLASAEGLRIPELAGAGPGAPSREDELYALTEMTDGFLPTDPKGWEIAILGGENGERRLNVGPENPQAIEVHVVAPPGPGRASYALKVSDDSSGALVGTIVELEATETELRISESSMEAWDEDPD